MGEPEPITPERTRQALRELVGPRVFQRADERWNDLEEDWDALRRSLQARLPNVTLRPADVRESLAILDEVADRLDRCRVCDPGRWTRTEGPRPAQNCASPLRPAVTRGGGGRLELRWVGCEVYQEWARRGKP